MLPTMIVSSLSLLALRHNFSSLHLPLDIHFAFNYVMLVFTQLPPHMLLWGTPAVCSFSSLVPYSVYIPEGLLPDSIHQSSNK